MPQNWVKNLFLVTILFFALGFFNIIFAWLGFACMIIPFILLARDKKKTWCNKYCPRASLFTVLLKNRSLTGKAAPQWLVKGKTKWVMLAYFTFNLFVLGMSTVMVFKGVREPMEAVRFLIAFQLPWDIPQLLQVNSVPDWAVHLAFRMYSMMFTTTILGLLLGWIYRPRTWCTICPVCTVSNLALSKMKSPA